MASIYYIYYIYIVYIVISIIEFSYIYLDILYIHEFLYLFFAMSRMGWPWLGMMCFAKGVRAKPRSEAACCRRS